MRPYIQLFGPDALRSLPRLPYEDVMDHLKREFGGYQRCAHHVMIMAPPVGATIEVVEELETCHPSGGTGLQGGRLMPGRYRVLEAVTADETSHWLNLFGEERSEIAASLCIGYYGDAQRTLIDWRGVRRAPPSPR